MKGTLQTLFIGLGILYALKEIAFRAGSTIMENVEVAPDSAKIKWQITNPTKVIIDIIFSVTNGNNIGGNVQGFEGELFYGAEKLGDIALSGFLTIPANSTAAVPLQAQVDITELPNSIANIIQGGTLLGSIRVKGLLRTSFVNIPLDMDLPLI
ncbi:MAG: LEA type 2 family protein [Chitinophagales bacterium]|nr:LEA type 2 family protein [Chitinophagales bacterium]